jgi:hypothetical protein
VDVKDHTQLVGAIVTNLQALETVLRYHSLGPKAQDVQFPTVVAPDALENDLTSYVSSSRAMLRQLCFRDALAGISRLVILLPCGDRSEQLRNSHARTRAIFQSMVRPLKVQHRKLVTSDRIVNSPIPALGVPSSPMQSFAQEVRPRQLTCPPARGTTL